MTIDIVTQNWISEINETPLRRYNDNETEVMGLPGLRKGIESEEVTEAFMNFHSKELAIDEAIRRCRPRKGVTPSKSAQEFYAKLWMSLTEAIAMEVLENQKELSISFSANSHKGESLRDGVVRRALGTVNPDNPNEFWIPKKGFIHRARFKTMERIHKAFSWWQDTSTKAGRDERDTHGISDDERKEFVENLRRKWIEDGTAVDLMHKHKLPLSLIPKLTIDCPIRRSK